MIDPMVHLMIERYMQSIRAVAHHNCHGYKCSKVDCKITGDTILWPFQFADPKLDSHSINDIFSLVLGCQRMQYAWTNTQMVQFLCNRNQPIEPSEMMPKWI